MLSSLLDDFKDAVVSGFSGSSRPTNLLAGGMWVDTSLQTAPNYIWSLKIYTGSTDIEVFKISVLTGTSGSSLANDSFTIKKISADSAGAILNLVKNRVANGGKVLSGDTVAELRLTGRTNSASNPVVAYIRATASEDQTTLNQGVSLSFSSSPVTTANLIEHLKFVSQIVESVLPHKVNSSIYGIDSVATAASLLLTSDKVLSELIGSTNSSIHGIEVGSGETRVKHIHNRSSAEITIRHASGSASAAERFSLPDSNDISLLPQESASFFYCDTDQRWKYLMGMIAGVRSFIHNFPGGYSEWVSPLTGNIRVLSFQEPSQEPTGANQDSSFARSGLKSYQAWGDNADAQLGVGDTTDRSYPAPAGGNPQLKSFEIGSETGSGFGVDEQLYCWGFNRHGQVLNTPVGLNQTIPALATTAISFTRVDIDESAWGQTFSGLLYAWGRNQHGQLGLGDVTPRSSPVAVLGGLKFCSVFHGAEGEASVFGVERDTGLLYAWGKNDKGQLGVGDVASRSSPVAVLGGLKFRKVAVGSSSVVGLTESGVPYAWGGDADGELGVGGGLLSRSSPVAVLGGLTFVDVFALPGSDNSFFGLTESGSLYAWGANTCGELGVGDVIPRSSPVAVLGGLYWERIARLNSNTRSIAAIQLGSGAAYSWGSNANGELGLGDVASRSSPVAVLGGLTFSHINFGNGFASGQSGNGRYYSWGKNNVGQLGDGTTVSKSSPVLVAGYTEPSVEVPILKIISVVRGQTYKIKIGGGASYFGSDYIGKNIRRATIAYEK